MIHGRISFWRRQPKPLKAPSVPGKKCACNRRIHGSSRSSASSPRSENKRRAAGMKRQQSLRVVQHDEELLPRIQALKAEYPFQGYLRI